MRFFQGAILLLFLNFSIAGSPISSETPTGEKQALPKILYHPVYPSSTAPVWVDASLAILPNGRFSEKFLVPEAIKSLRDQIRDQQGPDCAQLTEVYESLVNPPARKDVASATRTADLVVEATVTGKAFGFRQLIAGQLLRLRIDKIFKGTLPERADRFVFYPVATFQAGPYRICKTDRRYPVPPETGERVILFIPSLRNAKASFLELLDDASLVTIHENKKAELPRRFLKTSADKGLAAASTEKEVIAEIQKAMRKDGDR